MKHNRNDRKAFAEKHIHPKLRRSLRLYLIISLVVLILVIISTIRAHANVFIVGGGLVGGVVVGVIFNRIFKISWDHDADHAVYKTDVYGGVLLILYIIFDLSREHIVTLFIQGDAVGATSLALLSGAMYGRVLGSGKVIAKVFKEQRVLPSISKS